MRHQKRAQLKMDPESLHAYLREQFGQDTALLGAGEIGKVGEQGMKGFGYGKPVLIRFRVGGEVREAVLSVMRGDKYGHQFYWDRAAILMFQYETGGRMRRHVRPLGLGYVDRSNRMIAVREPREFFILNEKLEGHDYYKDLERIRSGDFRPADETLVKSFARWLSGVHKRRLDDPDLYLRRVRNLIGASECIFGLADAYPYPYPDFPPERFVRLEKRIIDWRWRLRDYTHRLADVHGDFHPWNVLIRDDGEFSVLDRSRGEWGEPADDVATMSCNYLLFGLYDAPRLSGNFERLYLTFWDSYLDRTNDIEMLKVIAPFYVFRGLVIASPEWYPGHPDPVRQGLLRFLENVLEDEVFDYRNINRYMAG